MTLWVKPCVRCGAEDRDKKGDCRLCANIGQKRRRDETRENYRAVENAWRAANAEKILERQRRWRAANPDKVAAIQERKRERDRAARALLPPKPVKSAEQRREEARIYARKYYRANREIMNEKSKLWRLKNHDAWLERVRSWHSTHKEYSKERRRIWRAENPDKVRELRRKYRKKHPDKQERAKIRRKRGRLMMRRAHAFLVTMSILEKEMT